MIPDSLTNGIWMDVALTGELNDPEGVDPGFPVGRGAPTYDFVKLKKNCMKLRKVWVLGACQDL